MSTLTFDFDRWATLARTDAAEFERCRLAALDEVCISMGGKDQPHIAAMCWRIEAERQRKHAQPMLHERLFRMMLNRFDDLDSAISNGVRNYQQQTCMVRTLVPPIKDGDHGHDNC